MLKYFMICAPLGALMGLNLIRTWQAEDDLERMFSGISAMLAGICFAGVML